MGPTQNASTLTCRVCRTENPATRQFCRKCAADLRAPVGAATEPVAPLDAPSTLRPIVPGGGLALLAVLVLAGTFILLSGGPAPSQSPSAPPPTPSIGAASPTAAAPTHEPTATAVGAEPTPTAGTVRPPRIRLFTAPETIECADPSHSGFIHVRWEIRNATGVTISIDGPGIYREYQGLTGEDDLPFSCSQSHTYLLTTVGGVGPPATREVIVEPVGS